VDLYTNEQEAKYKAEHKQKQSSTRPGPQKKLEGPTHHSRSMGRDSGSARQGSVDENNNPNLQTHAAHFKPLTDRAILPKAIN
jgi:hypothetical protein